MIDLTLDNLSKHLNKIGFESEIQTETNQVYHIFKIQNYEFPLFLKIAGDGELLQLLVFLPSAFDDSTRPELARLLHYINKEMDIPGFGMDESNGVIFYRVMLPSLGKKIDTNTLDSFLRSIKPVCETFAPAILTVASGTLTFEEILKKLSEAGKSA